MSVFTPMDDNLSDSGDLLSVELFSAITTNLNHLITCAKPGKIAMIIYGFAGVPAPDPKYWQLCDGSAITDENSPLRGQNTPNYRGRYLRGYDTIGTVGDQPGTNTKNLAHSHGGTTNAMNALDETSPDEGSDRFTTLNHTHTIASDLGTAINFEPIHFRILHYIKIN